MARLTRKILWEERRTRNRPKRTRVIITAAVMTNLQLYLAVGLPVVANAALFLLFQSNMHRLIDAFRSEVDARLEGPGRTMDARFDGQMQALLRVAQQR